MPIEEPHMLWVITMWLMGFELILIITLLPFLIVMHNMLSPRLDPILFKEPWFHPQQLIIFNSWPMSFIKSVIYMFLIAYPNYTRRKKRFKDLKEVPVVSSSIQNACKLYTILHLLMVFSGIVMFLYVGSIIALIESGYLT